MIIKITEVPSQPSRPGKIADVELRFTAEEGPLAGLRLTHVIIWQEKPGGRGRRVYFPGVWVPGSRQKRPTDVFKTTPGDTVEEIIKADCAMDNLRVRILRAYAESIGEDPDEDLRDQPGDAE